MIKVLIVEDEVIIAKEISMTLERNGYKVLDLATSYESLVESLKKETPDVILMDIMISGEIDGIESAIKIKENYDVPVIFLTGYSDKTTVEKAKLSNPYGYIVKPVKYEDLRITIEIAVYKYKFDKQMSTLQKEKYIKERMLMRAQRLVSLGELSASIAHEIRQPLNTIKILTDSMIYWNCQNPNPNPMRAEHCENHIKISESIDRINKIINQMNNMIKRNDRENPKQIEVNDALKNIINIYKERLIKKNININLSLDSSISSILFSEIQFEQVITNLLNNAINAHNKSDKTDKIIAISTQNGNKGIIIEISDNAIGIKEDIIEKIFDPLYTTENDKESMGLGLYIVNNILNSYDSTIICENNAVGGVTFKVFINYSDSNNN